MKEQTLGLPLQALSTKRPGLLWGFEGTLLTKRQILYDSGNLMKYLEKANS